MKSTIGTCALRWMVLVAMLGLMGCNQSSTSPDGEGGVSLPPSGLVELLEAGRSLVLFPDEWLPKGLLLDSALVNCTLIDSPFVDLLRPGRHESGAYLVGDSTELAEYQLPYSEWYSTTYRFDSSAATLMLSETGSALEDRRQAVAGLSYRDISRVHVSNQGKNRGTRSWRILDADGDGRLRSAGTGKVPLVTITGEMNSYFGLAWYESRTSEVVIGSGSDGRFATPGDNGLRTLSYGGFNRAMVDTAKFRSDDTVAGAIWNAPMGTGTLERRVPDYVLSASIHLGSDPTFRDLRVSLRASRDTFWTTTTTGGAGVLNWVGGDGRTDTVRIDLVGKDWFRLPSGEKRGYYSRPMADTTWSREDLEWTQSVPDPSSFVANGTFRFRRWSRDGGGVWYEGTWSIDEWNQRSFVKKGSGKL